MDKKYIDYVTGEKVTLEEWNRRNNERKKQNNLLQGLNIPASKVSTSSLLQPNIQRAVRAMSQPTAQPVAQSKVQPTQPRPTIQSAIQSALKPTKPVKPILKLPAPDKPNKTAVKPQPSNNDYSWWDKLKESTIGAAKIGYKSADRGQEIGQAIINGDMAKAERLMRESAPQYKTEATGWIEKGARGMFEMLGQLTNQSLDPRTQAMGLSAAGVATAAGQAGPQVLVPEELATVPGAYIAGISAGNALANAEIETGFAYEELIESGVDKNLARNIAMGVGAVNGTLELIQLDELVKSYKIFEKSGVDDKVKKSFLSKLGTEIAKRVSSVAKETGQEVAQEGVTIAGSNLGRSMSGLPTDTLKEVVSRLGETAGSSLLTFGFMNVPGAVMDVGRVRNATQTTTKPGRVIAPESVDTETKTFLEKVANKTGINIEVAEIYDKAGRQMSAAEGYYDRSQNKMVFAPDTSKSNIIKGVVMHELTHSIEGSKLYNEYANFAINNQYKNQQEFDNAIQTKIQQYANEKISIKPDDAQKELVAEITRNTIFDEASINKLVAEKSNIAVQIYESIVKAIDTARAYITGDTETIELEKARKLFEKALGSRGVNYNKTANIQYSTGSTPNGLRYTVIDNNIINLDKSERKDATAKIIDALDGKQIVTEDGSVVTIRGQQYRDWYTTTGKMTSWDSKYDEDTYYNKKLPFAAQSDEIYETSVKKGEKGDIDDLHGAFADKFKYREAIVKLGEEWFKLNLSVMSDANEDMAYNIGRIKPISEEKVMKIRKKSAYQNKGLLQKDTKVPQLPASETLSNPILTQNSPPVKTDMQIALEKAGVDSSIFENDEKDTRQMSIKDASAAGATTDTIEDAKREWQEKGTDSKYFKKWFGDSKIVDEDGKPLVVYHGTDADFMTFDVAKGRSNMDIQGAFFSPWYVDAKGYGQNVRAFYLSIKNPASEAVAYKALNMFKGQNNAGIKAREYLESLGYDGVNNGGEEYIAFYPTQIKSATDNIGTFDENNPDIRYSIKDDKIKPVAKSVADDLLKEYDSEYDGNNLENEIADLYKKMQTSLIDGTGEYTEEELGNMTREIAAKVLENMRLYEGVLSDEDKGLLQRLRKSRISIDSVNKSDLSDDYNAFRKRFMGKLLLVKNGLPVDSFYKELAELYPQYFNEEEHSNPGDQLQHIADVVDEIKSRLPVNDYKDDKKEINNIIRTMLKGYVKIITTPNAAEGKIDTDTIKRKISRFYTNTIKRATAIPEDVKEKLNPESFDFIPESSAQWQAQAEKNVSADMDGVIEKLKNAPSISGGIEGHEAAVIAQKLVNKFKETGREEDFKKMQDFLKLVATKTRESARALKATDTAWDKTDPAAAVVRAHREVQKATDEMKKRNPKMFSDAESEKKSLKTRMKNAEKLTQKDKADKKLTDEQAKKLEDKRKKQMLERWVRDTAPRAKQKNLLEKIQEMYDAGAYNDEALSRLVSEKRGIPYLSLDEVKKIISYTDKANDSKEGSYEQKMAYSRAEQIIESKIPVAVRDKINAFPRISVLTGTRTQVRNIEGNIVNGGYEAARENTVGLLVDAITSKFTGERTLSGDVAGKTTAYMKGFGKGIHEWYLDIKNKVDTSPTKTRGEVKRNSRTFNSAFLNAIDEVVKKGLSLGDRPFYQGAYEARLYELGKLNENAKNKMSMEEMVADAQAYALDKVYQNDSTVKKVATRLRNVSTAIDNPFWQSVTEAGMTITVPFTETPANIFDKVLENSPIGIAKAIGELGKTKKGTFNQLEFVQNLSRGLTGTGLMAAGAMLFAKGLIAIVPYDEEYDKNKFLQSMGVQNYALKVGNKYYSLSWLEPIATPLLIGAEMLRGKDDDKNILENIYGTTKIAIDSFFEASFVQGISELFSGGSIGEGISNKLLDAHSMFTPLSAFSKSLAQWADPYVRETKDDNAIMQMLKERVAQTPFLSKTLPAKIDAFGNEMKTLDGKNNVFNVFFNPANVTEYVTTEVHDELIKVYDNTKDVNVFPDYISKPEITYDGSTVKLDDKGLEKHKKEIGRALYDEYEKLFNTDAYKNMTSDEKVKAIRDAKDDIKNQANFKTIKSNGDFLSNLTQNKQMYYDKTDVKLEADYLTRWEELTPNDNKVVRDARLYSAINAAVKDFDKSGILDKDNMAKIKQYAENKCKRDVTMMDINLLSVYRATGDASVFNTNYQGLLEFTEKKIPRIINYPKTLLPELLSKSDSAVMEAYSKVMLKNDWLTMTPTEKQSALKKAKDKARKTFEEDLKNKYGARINTSSDRWQSLTPLEKSNAK